MRGGSRFIVPTFLATTVLLGASTFCAHAQSEWNGGLSNDWFENDNWIGNRPLNTTDAIINTVMFNSTAVGSPGATAQDLAIGENATGTLAVQTGGTLTTSFATVGDLPGGLGTVTVTGPGSTWTNGPSGGLNIGNLGTGHAHGCRRRHCQRSYSDRNAYRFDWNAQHRRGRGQSSGCTWHAHCANHPIWRWGWHA
jgi:T5SS/PEP-CTERM-associated repeat protein